MEKVKIINNQSKKDKIMYRQKFEDFQKMNDFEKIFGMQYDIDNVSVGNFDTKCDVKEDVKNKKTNYSLYYELAVASGALTGIFDAIYGQGLSHELIKNLGQKDVEKLILKYAKKFGYEGNDFSKATIKFLEQIFPSYMDKFIKDLGGPKLHHLFDFYHHNSIIGLAFSIQLQFTGIVIGIDGKGNFCIVGHVDKDDLGKDFAQKIQYAFVNWFFHLVSDMDGSSSALGDGMGIPGPILSLLTFVNACLPAEIKKALKSETIAKDLFEGKFGFKFDYREELGVLKCLENQAKPVLINEILTRTCYFILSFINEIKINKIKKVQEINKINVRNVLPLNNRVITRMITISSGIFVGISAGKATAKALPAAETGIGGFAVAFVLNVNIVGVGRFAIAVAADRRYIVADVRSLTKNIATKCREMQKLDQPLIDVKTNIIDDINNFKLDDDQTKLMYSLELIKLDYDCKNTKNILHKKQKKKWIQEWIDATEKTTNALLINASIKDSEKLVSTYNKCLKRNVNLAWLYRVILELQILDIYYTKGKNELDKFKSLKFDINFEKDYLDQIISEISYNEMSEMKKEYDKYYSKFFGNDKGIILLATSLVALLTGGGALVFSPAIAVAFASAAFPTLNGAALTSASLSFLGGGSLAVGGTGMVSGTAVITGGGVLMGALSAGASTMTVMNMLSSKEFVAKQCATIITYCDYVLIKKMLDLKQVNSIQKKFERSLIKIEKGLKKIKIKELGLINKKRYREAFNGVKIMKRCNSELKKLVYKK